jgi:hypothetical protein
MAATAARAVYSHVTKTPGICGGKACIDSTRIRVMDVVWLPHQTEALSLLCLEQGSARIGRGLRSKIPLG